MQYFSLCPKFVNVTQSVVKIDPEIMSGTPCFAGTRVPIQNLIDYLAGELLEKLPGASAGVLTVIGT